MSRYPDGFNDWPIIQHLRAAYAQLGTPTDFETWGVTRMMYAVYVEREANRARLEALEAAIGDPLALIEEQSGRIRELEFQITTLNQRIAELTHQRDALQVANDNLSEQVGMLQTENASLRHVNAELEKEAERLNNLTRQLTAEKRELADRVVALSHELAAVQDALQAAENTAAYWKEKYEMLINPPPPPVSDYDGGKIWVAWLAWQRDSAALLSFAQANRSRLKAIVTFGDLVNIGGRDDLKRIRDLGIDTLAYVRAPVHMRVNRLDNGFGLIGPSIPFEHEVGKLVRDHDGYVYDTNGKVMWHPSGSDVYLDPTKVAERHAHLVLDHLWNAEAFSGLLADGLVTNQIYAQPAAIADFDRDGKADVDVRGWATVAQAQRVALADWALALAAAGVMVIGNGSWEARYLDVLSGNGYNNWIMVKNMGAMSEDASHPLYVNGDNNQQRPSTSQRWDMHVQAALTWTALGRPFLFGDNMRLLRLAPFNMPVDQLRRFAIATALITDAYIVTNDVHNPLLNAGLGKPLDVARNPVGLSIADYAGVDRGAYIWTRKFSGVDGTEWLIECDAVVREGRIKRV